MAKAYKTLRMRASDARAAMNAHAPKAGTIAGVSAAGIMAVWVIVWPEVKPIIERSIEVRREVAMAKVEAGRAMAGLTAWQTLWPRNGSTNTVGGTLLRMERDIDMLKLRGL